MQQTNTEQGNNIITAIKERQPLYIASDRASEILHTKFDIESYPAEITQTIYLFLDELNQKDIEATPVIIAYDKHEQDTAKMVAKRFESLGFNTYASKYYGNTAGLDAVIINEDEETLKAEQQNVDKFIADEYKKKNSTAYYLQDFLESVANKTPPIDTGFNNLNGILDGGLYSGLYTFGAVSSLGKTTFMLQIADHIASKDRDVLLFSLEMARNEIIAKSISRNTLTYAMANGIDERNAKSTRAIMNIDLSRESNETKDLVINAIEQYKNTAGNVYIKQAQGQISVDYITTAVKEHKAKTGKAPVVFIDYLQLLAPTNDRLTDKQAMDRNVLLLKQLSRDYSIPVVVISSLNRDNYTEPINLAGMKESGIIEYSSDVVIGLQYEGMDYETGESSKSGGRATRIFSILEEQKEKAKKGDAQAIQVKVLKNRTGTRADCYFDFYPIFNYFKESKPHKKEKLITI